MSRKAIATALEETEMKAVTGVGEPSYTSGAHIWNGKMVSLKPIAARTNKTPSLRSGSAGALWAKAKIASKLNEPAQP